MRSEKNKHTHFKSDTDSSKCKCGAYICGVLSPDKKLSCNLRSGHAGNHANEWTKANIQWLKAK